MKKELFKELCNTPGLSGREERIVSIVEKELKKYNFDIERDNLGSIYGIKKSIKKNAKTLLIDAHMDEVGLRIVDFTDNGLIKIEEFGAISKFSLFNQRVNVHLENNEIIQGFVGGDTKDISNFSIPKISDMFVDIGVSSKKEIIDLGIKIGDMITFNSDVVFTKERIISKAADDRVGILIILELLEYIKNNDFDYNIVVSATTQEEVGIRGAKAAAYKYKPDIAMTIDVSPSKDFPKETGEGKLGGGTMLRHFDRLTLTNKKSIEFLKNILIKHKIKYQDYFSLGGTNAGSISLANDGTIILPIGLLARNLHTSSLIFDIKDYENTLKFCKIILSELNNSKIESLGFK